MMDNAVPEVLWNFYREHFRGTTGCFLMDLGPYGRFMEPLWMFRAMFIANPLQAFTAISLQKPLCRYHLSGSSREINEHLLTFLSQNLCTTLPL